MQGRGCKVLKIRVGMSGKKDGVMEYVRGGDRKKEAVGRCQGKMKGRAGWRILVKRRGRAGWGVCQDKDCIRK